MSEGKHNVCYAIDKWSCALLRRIERLMKVVKWVHRISSLNMMESRLSLHQLGCQDKPVAVVIRRERS